MKKPQLIPLILLAGAILFSGCRKNTSQPTQPQPEPQQVPDPQGKAPGFMVKKVTWDVVSIQFMNFEYNADSSLKSVQSGVNTQPTVYTEVFQYRYRQLKESLFEQNDVTKYEHDSEGRLTALVRSIGGKERSREEYFYNAKNELSHAKWYVAFFNGPLKLSWESTYSYDGMGMLKMTESKSYDENTQLTSHLIRAYDAHTPELEITPLSLLHPLYQHQDQAVYNVGFLHHTKHLPVKIAETGRAGTGDVKYTYKFVLDGKRIEKLSCVIEPTNGGLYETNQAVFHY